MSSEPKLSTRYLHTGIPLLGDAAVVCLSLVLAYYVRLWLSTVFQLIPLTQGIGFYLLKGWPIFVIIASIAYHGGYGVVINVWDDMLLIVRSLFVAFLLIWMIFSLQKETESVSRMVIVLAFLCMLIMIPSARFLLKSILYRTFDIRREAAIIGSEGGKEKDIIHLLNREWYSGYRITRSIRSDQATPAIGDTCFMPLWSADVEAIKDVRMSVKNLILITDISGLSFMDSHIKTLLSENVALITSSNGLLSTEKMVLKRIFDLFFCLLFFIIFLPILFGISIIIRVESKGPILFRHRRCGKHLSEFEMLKFRTMHPNGEEQFKKYIQENSEARKSWLEKNKVKNDPRVTWFGKILRKASFDELPQLLNVLKGDMSLVGPRPDTKEALTTFYDQYREIYSRVKPGITGLWQVSGRSDIDYAKRVKLDYLYVLNWSPWLDFVIILKTFRTIVSGKGAY
jgi:exopolysaccharide biosynthesis polyprenyl glycosylphosphotransferase